MKIPAPHYRCPLARIQPEVIDLEAVKREAWQSLRLLVVSDTDPRLDWLERGFVRRLAERLYGEVGEA